MTVNGAVSIRKLVFLGSPEKAMSYHLQYPLEGCKKQETDEFILKLGA
jgi:hypothetical protein